MQLVKRRLDHFSVMGRQLRLQPPIRVEYCERPPRRTVEGVCSVCGDALGGTGFDCILCGFPFCTSHQATHKQGLSAPPDAWLGIWRRTNGVIQKRFGGNPAKSLWKQAGKRLENYAHGEKILDARRPYRIVFCQQTNRKHADYECVQPSPRCTKTKTTCQTCFFSFCGFHGPLHRRHWMVPAPLWPQIVSGFEREVDKCARTRGKHKIHVRTPKWKD
jgi:hypothetical protein